MKIKKIVQLFARKPKSSGVAKQRLKLVLTQDRFDVSSPDIKRLHHELAEVLAKYFNFTMSAAQLSLRQEGNSYVLVADFPYENAG